MQPVFTVLLMGALTLSAAPLCAQNYPNKPIRFVTTEAGGGSDFVTRLIAQGLTASLGQTIVENRAGGVIPGETVAKASPDGYTLLLSGGILWLEPFLMEHAPWDPVRDFSPVTLATGSPTILVVHPSVSAKSVTELIALAKAKPGALNYGSAGAGGASQLAAELFKAMASVNIMRIPYKGNGQVLNALMSGEIQLTFAPSGLVMSQVKAGRLRALGVTSARPSALLPDLPTVASSGLPGYESGSMLGIFVPAGTLTNIINRLNQEIVRVLARSDVKEKLLATGVEPIGSTPDEFAAFIKAEMTRMGKVIKDAGIRAD